jgi:DNA ligase-1
MKPMLATDVADFSEMRYPVYGSPKLDGVRALMPEKEILPRSLKRFPNPSVNAHFNRFAPQLTGFDGELIYGQLNASDMCRQTSSVLASHTGEPEVHWHIFDLVNVGYTFEERLALLKQRFKHLSSADKKMRVHLVPQTLIRNAAEAEAFEHEQLSRGYEGVVWKSPSGLYKFGRGTLREQVFLRTKRFTDAEGVVIEVIELQRNGNEATRNELGNQVRSHHKAGKTGGGVMGSLMLRVTTGPLEGQTFELGTGFDAVQRRDLWEKRDTLIGKVVKFKYFAHGVKDKPRWPSFLGFRAGFDMS